MQVHQLQGYIQSIYLVEYSDKLLLLDGCTRADVGLLRSYIENKLQRPFTDLALVVVTHMHPDHAGAAEILKKVTRCKIATANVAGNWYQGLDGVLMLATDILLAHWVAKRMGKPKRRLWYSGKINADYLLADGDTLPGFEEWQVHFTQGHTDRDLSLLHKPSQKLYVADLMVKVKGRYIPPFPVFYPNRYKASLKKVEQMNVASIWLAHEGEVCLTDEDYQHLYLSSPSLPQTHWRSVKSKLLTVLKNK